MRPERTTDTNNPKLLRAIDRTLSRGFYQPDGTYIVDYNPTAIPIHDKLGRIRNSCIASYHERKVFDQRQIRMQRECNNTLNWLNECLDNFAENFDWKTVGRG